MKKRFIALFVAAALLALCLAACTQGTKELTVDNPALLEFPGLKWGMTVQEVKTALNLEQGQILHDAQDMTVSSNLDADYWHLYAKDLTVFDSKVTVAIFTFMARNEDQIAEGMEYRAHTGGEYVLQGVQVYLDEGTDMQKLEQTMAQIYGEGVGGTYQYTECLSGGNPNITSIYANPTVRALSQAGNPYQLALNASDYQEQMWICSDDNVLPAASHTYFMEMLQGHGHSEEDCRQWLGQAPWITLRLTNHSVMSIAKENGAYDGEYSDYITRNFLEYRTNEDVCIAQSAALKSNTEK